VLVARALTPTSGDGTLFDEEPLDVYMEAEGERLLKVVR
jgi:hypothetical protein